MKIISGGQTGADKAGLEAARELGIETGGTAPDNYLIEKGSDKTLKDFRLVALGTYRTRTLLNVINSDGTVIFGKTSGGFRLTKGYCIKRGKPFIINPTPLELRKFIRKNYIKILNVAGNRESKNPGIGKRVREIIILALKE